MPRKRSPSLGAGERPIVSPFAVTSSNPATAVAMLPLWIPEPCVAVETRPGHGNVRQGREIVQGITPAIVKEGRKLAVGSTPAPR